MFVEQRGEPRHFFGKGFAVFFSFCCADVAAGRQDVVVARDFFCGGGVAVGGFVVVVVRFLPTVVGVGDAFDVGVAEVALRAVFHVAQVARVDEEGFALARFGFVQYPDAGGDLGVGKELAGQGNHRFYQVCFYQGAADVAFAAALAAHRAVGEQERHAAARGEVVEHVL